MRIEPLDNFKPPKVMLAMPIGSGMLPWETAKGLLATQAACIQAGVPLRIEPLIGCSIVSWARTALVDAFLKWDGTHMFWIDADMAWSPSDFMQVLGKGAVLDIVGATYPLKRDPVQVFINELPGDTEINGLDCVKVRSLGMGFVCMKRAVVEAVAAEKEFATDSVNGLTMRDVFRIDRGPGGTARGEDVAFFDDARRLGYDLWLDPAVKLGHIGLKTWRGDPIEALGLQDYFSEKANDA